MYYCCNTHEISHTSSVQIRSTQHHDYHHDTSDTIVETRAQRAHKDQTRNNLQAGETGSNLQEKHQQLQLLPTHHGCSSTS